jgi:hypothetical protein
MKIVDIIPEYFVQGASIGPKHKDVDTSLPNTNTNRLPKPTSGLYLGLDVDKSKDTPLTKDTALDILKHVVKKVRGKEPVYTTKGGTEVNVDAWGKDKGIQVKKTF